MKRTIIVLGVALMLVLAGCGGPGDAPEDNGEDPAGEDPMEEDGVEEDGVEEDGAEEDGAAEDDAEGALIGGLAVSAAVFG
ncbi:DNA polymerase V family protein [Halobacteria archaeon AArc-m2/3/4]|uniref:DNA polymerase V family protein n=1 Tax=Natronoglomus mannanivorans TaxID=2979990 RepID=A0AAP2Z1F5_9EURY|nr:DNA polymerase V family protein [Halobacteria archaeon AArc-xg1-1]MCU4974170.1 DNA polymerase V family protein [Halobacteria archaeon AArc-m2/3/4]